MYVSSLDLTTEPNPNKISVIEMPEGELEKKIPTFKRFWNQWFRVSSTGKFYQQITGEKDDVIEKLNKWKRYKGSAISPLPQKIYKVTDKNTYYIETKLTHPVVLSEKNVVNFLKFFLLFLMKFDELGIGVNHFDPLKHLMFYKDHLILKVYDNQNILEISQELDINKTSFKNFIERDAIKNNYYIANLIMPPKDGDYEFYDLYLKLKDQETEDIF